MVHGVRLILIPGYYWYVLAQFRILLIDFSIHLCYLSDKKGGVIRSSTRHLLILLIY